MSLLAKTTASINARLTNARTAREHAKIAARYKPDARAVFAARKVAGQ
jgi:hypothetical protein